MSRKISILLISIVFVCMFLFIGCGGGDSGGGGSSGETGSIEGTVLDENSNPLEGVLCSIAVDKAKEAATIEGTTDEQGNYLINGIPVGRWIMKMELNGYQIQQITIRITANQTTTQPPITLSPEGTGGVSGIATSSASGNPVIAGAEITIYAGNLTPTTTTDSQGLYSFTEIIAGTHDIKASAIGFLEYSSTVTVQADSVTIFNITMTQSSSPSPTPSPGLGNVAGKVVDVNGSPLADVQVNAEKSSKAVTDSSGSYLVENLNPGTDFKPKLRMGQFRQTVQSQRPQLLYSLLQKHL
jgi:hypothetical protein